jgi:hypothetical protein
MHFRKMHFRNPNRTFPLRVQSLYRTRGAAKDKAKGSFYLACCLASPGSPRIRRVASECIYARYQFRAFERDFGNQCIFFVNARGDTLVLDRNGNGFSIVIDFRDTLEFPFFRRWS